jgi:2,4-dienoyl-CoA reductase-like NADH-dependent reductase (Old Yellow Enzyme family)
MEPIARINRFMKAQGTVPGIQIAHAGRKASAARP